MTKPTPNRTEALAQVVAHLRPDWQLPGIIKALAACGHRPYADTVLAATRCATDPNVRTPGAIPTDGPHWFERIAPRDTWGVLTAIHCDICGGIHTADSPCNPREHERPSADEIAAIVAQARADIAYARRAKMAKTKPEDDE